MNVHSGRARSASGQRKKPSRSLLSRAIALLARRDHSRAELARKLAPYVVDGDPSQLERALDELARTGLISDARFASAVSRSRSQRFGDARIRYDLRRFGVADDLSAAALAQLGGTEAERASAVRSKRFARFPVSPAERGRQARFLQSRGFSLDTIYQVLRAPPDVE